MSDQWDALPWPHKRTAILVRDDFECQECDAPATEVDHIWPRNFGGPDDKWNLRAICKTCNAIKGDTLYIKNLTWRTAIYTDHHFRSKAFRALRTSAMWLAICEALDSGSSAQEASDANPEAQPEFILRVLLELAHELEVDVAKVFAPQHIEEPAEDFA